MIEIEIMRSKWMCLLELNRRIISIQKPRACFRLSLTSAEMELFLSICGRYALNTKKNC